MYLFNSITDVKAGKHLCSNTREVDSDAAGKIVFPNYLQTALLYYHYQK